MNINDRCSGVDGPHDTAIGMTRYERPLQRRRVSNSPSFNLPALTHF